VTLIQQRIAIAKAQRCRQESVSDFRRTGEEIFWEIKSGLGEVKIP